ncbi:MAG: GNAT family N-acetyltransferase [Bacteroidetes bacterium]|nr:GNAT family N-acetyltransferase [Bacteroidota bacterium]
MEHFTKEIISLQERLAVFPVYHQLNPRLSQEEFERRMTTMMQYKNYHLLGIFSGERCVAISGYWIGHKLYCGKYIEPDNVVVDREFRSMGIGEILQKKLEQIARENACEVMMLDAYLDNEGGHRFYERHGYVRKGFHFVKNLSE